MDRDPNGSYDEGLAHDHDGGGAPMRPIRFPWGRKARRQRALAAARDWQDYERQQAYIRISGLAEILRKDRS